MKNEQESKSGVYGREFERALSRWDDDPRSVIGGNAIGRATSTNEGGWVPPRDIGYSDFKQEDLESENDVEIKPEEISIVTNSKMYSERANSVKRASDLNAPVIQEVTRGDGTRVKIRAPGNQK